MLFNCFITYLFVLTIIILTLIFVLCQARKIPYKTTQCKIHKFHTKFRYLYVPFITFSIKLAQNNCLINKSNPKLRSLIFNQFSLENLRNKTATLHIKSNRLNKLRKTGEIISLTGKTNCVNTKNTCTNTSNALGEVVKISKEDINGNLVKVSIMPSAKFNVDIKTPTKGTGLQKFCASPKSWLKTTIKSGADKIVNNNPKSDDHTYENIAYKKTSIKKQADNVTVIPVPYQEKSKDDNKLKIVIDNFDKILNEFGDVKTHSPPKLQKSKTCSIIESKCILKKSSSNPLVLDEKSNLVNSSLTKSLSDIDVDCTFDKNTPAITRPIPPARKHVIKSDTFTKSSPRSTITLQTSKPQLKRSNSNNSTPGCVRSSTRTEMTPTKSKYVTEIDISTTPRTSRVITKPPLIEKHPERTSRVSKSPINSELTSARSKFVTAIDVSTPKTSKMIQKPLSEITKSKYVTEIDISTPRTSKAGAKTSGSDRAVKMSRSNSTHTLSVPLDKFATYKITSKLELCSKSADIPSKPTSIPLSVTRLSKAKSHWDVSLTPKCRPSKIPVKASLNKLLSPSTPAGLNHILDCKLESAKDLQDIIKLQEKIAEQEKLLLEDTIIRISDNVTANLRRVRSVANNIGLSDSRTLDKCINTGNRILRQVEALGEPKQSLKKTLSVKNVIDRLELASKSPSPDLKTTPKLKVFKPDPTKSNSKSSCDEVDYQKQYESKSNKLTFGNTKHNYEDLFMDSLESIPTNATQPNTLLEKTNNIQSTISKTTPNVSQIENIKFDLKTARELVDSVKYVTTETLNNPDLQSCATSAKIEKVIAKVNEQEIKIVDLKNDGVVKSNYTNINAVVIKHSAIERPKDYNSDCSDDSGNISNDIDLDCEIEEDHIVLCETVDKSDDTLNDLGSVAVEPQFKSEIFFRAGVLGQLEARRDERLQGRVVALQAHCRGYLARKKLAHRRLQDLAVRCIQRNVRKFMLVRDWPWWRLLVRVTPLLNVHRTEEQLKLRTEELENLRIKVEKLEQERTTLKYDNDKLESKLSEMTADLAEEHSTSTLASERLDAETQERIRLERELSDISSKNKSLQQSSERLEMELLYARSDLNGIHSEEDEDGEADGGVYKQRYERVARELEFTRRRLQQQHEDDLEQLVGLKKQLEKKLADAYEEVEEQRQVVGQWKRKVQKLNAETNDLRLLLEEQSARNNLLEKKQRKFDSETQLLHDELRQEKQTKDRISREKEIVLAEKYTTENNLADTRLELELQTEKLHSLQRELDEITFGGKTEEEVTVLRKQKLECDRKLHEQEEELDEMAGQTQILEQAKLRLEMALEQARKESKREAQQRDEELEEVRCNAQKKVKALEAQLENEHEERTLLLREKHELERRLNAAHEAERNERAGDEALHQRLKRDLRRTKALLRDAQTMLERQKADSPGKAVLRQLRHQLEDTECARTNAVKAKQSMEIELSEAQAQFEEAQRQRTEAEDKAAHANRERTELRTQLEENEEELAEVLKKFKSAVQQMSVDQLALQEQVSLVSELESERNSLKEQLAELTTKLESIESLGDPTSNLLAKRMELRCKELESKLELEQTTRSRLEVQIARLKETVDKLQTEYATSRTKEQVAQENIRKLQRSQRELRDEFTAASSREMECLQKRKEMEKKVEAADAETSAAKADLRLALKRIEDLQSAIQGELEDTISDNTDSEQDSYSSDESIETFLANHKISSSKSSDRTSLKLDSSPH